MKKIIECVPNFSEGRDQKVIDAIADAIKSVAGVTLLDVDPGKSTNRTVYTFVGDENAIVEGALAGAKAAKELIDMRKHHGEHPRMGAMDVCPFVPVANVTMAAKVKYLVEKKHINPEEIIVISYTNKAIGELRDRINKGLKIPAKICTFHAFAFEIVKRFSVEPPEINFSSYQIVFDMLEKNIFSNKQLMRNLVLLLGYYFDLTEDVFKFDNLNQYHLYKSSQPLWHSSVSPEELKHSQLTPRPQARQQ